MVKYVLEIGYDGTAFSGFQRQSEALSVQGELERGLSLLFNTPITLSGAGRTDAGVHALGQVVAFSHQQLWEAAPLGRGLQSVLRGPICIHRVAVLEAHDPFHPRYSAKSRTYLYFLIPQCQPLEALFHRKQAWCLSAGLDLEAMSHTFPLLLGQHDFSTYSFRSTEKSCRIRDLLALKFAAPPLSVSLPTHGLCLRVTANGFLRRMVRYLVAQLVEVGQGLTCPEVVSERLAATNPDLAPHPAPSHGLYLEKVEFPNDPFEASGNARQSWRANWSEKIRWDH